jgi:hypothetical protein
MFLLYHTCGRMGNEDEENRGKEPVQY